MNRASLFIPLVLFIAFIAIGYAGFRLNDPHQLPSALLDKPFPEFSAPMLRDPTRTLTREDLLGAPVLINVWATWCPTCLAEHAELLRITRDYGLRIVGVNYKDDPAKALGWLAQYGDPYQMNVQDPQGHLGVELGIYGAPESFLLDAQGVIRYKRVGDINPRIWRDELTPVLAAISATAQQTQ